MPEHTDDKTNVTPPQPIPNPPGPNPDDNDGGDGNDGNHYDNCTNTDNGAVDPYGDDCYYYDEAPGWCEDPNSINDETGFNPIEMCCICGGGDNGDDGPTPGPNPDDTCVDNMDYTDPYGEDCGYYTDYPQWCDYEF